MTNAQYQTAGPTKANSARSLRSKKPYTKQYARRTKRFIPLDRDPVYLESVDRAANPPGLIPTDEWFAQHPNEEFRLTWHGKPHDMQWSTFRFFAPGPRWAPCYEFWAWQLCGLLAEPEFKTGTPRERLKRVFRWLKREGVFRNPFN